MKSPYTRESGLQAISIPNMPPLSLPPHKEPEASLGGRLFFQTHTSTEDKHWAVHSRDAHWCVAIICPLTVKPSKFLEF